MVTLQGHLWPEGGNRLDHTKKSPQMRAFFFLYRLGKCFKFHAEQFVIHRSKKCNETKCKKKGLSSLNKEGLLQR